MRRQSNPFNKRVSITISTLDQPRKRPFSIVMKKSLFVFFCIVFIGAVSAGVFAGISAYLSVGKLSVAVDDLSRLVAQGHLFGYQDVFEQNISDTDDFDWENLAIITDEQIILDSSDAARMSDPWLEVTSETEAYSIELESGSINGRVELISWYNGMQGIIERDTQIVVIDVDTGLSFQARRIGGTHHSDTEPVSSDDTAVLKKIYGGRWSWNRRAIWVKVGNRYFAASMNGMPHSNGRTRDNKFSGHFCIHFLDSRVHETSRRCPVHQSKIIKAFSCADMLEEYLDNNQY